MSFIQYPNEIKLTDIYGYRNIFETNDIHKINKLRLTDISLYSTSIWKESKNVIKILNKIWKKDLNKMNVLDVGCNIGGQLLYFSNECNKVYGIEYEPLHVEICYNNLSILANKKNYSVYLSDAEKLFLNKNNKTYKYDSNNYQLVENKFENIDIVYLGTPFVSLAYGNTLIDDLTYKINDMLHPKIFIIALPGQAYTDIHKNFFNNKYKKFIINMINKSFNVYISCSRKKKLKTGCSLLTLFFYKTNRPENYYCNHNMFNSNIIRSIKEVSCNLFIFKINVYWKYYYFNHAYYTTCHTYNNNLFIETYIRNTNIKKKYITKLNINNNTKINGPYDKTKKQKCIAKINLFNKIIHEIFIYGKIINFKIIY
jgi:16S rRNA G966 N2-methylase RsmD